MASPVKLVDREVTRIEYRDVSRSVDRDAIRQMIEQVVGEVQDQRRRPNGRREGAAGAVPRRTPSASRSADHRPRGGGDPTSRPRRAVARQPAVKQAERSPDRAAASAAQRHVRSSQELARRDEARRRARQRREEAQRAAEHAKDEARVANELPAPVSGEQVSTAALEAEIMGIAERIEERAGDLLVDKERRDRRREHLEGRLGLRCAPQSAAAGSRSLAGTYAAASLAEETAARRVPAESDGPMERPFGTPKLRPRVRVRLRKDESEDNFSENNDDLYV
jgi:hypothetical protein